MIVPVNHLIIAKELLLLFLRDGKDWRVALIDLNYLLIKTDYLSEDNILSIQSKSKLFEWNQLHEIPLIPLSVEVPSRLADISFSCSSH